MVRAIRRSIDKDGNLKKVVISNRLRIRSISGLGSNEFSDRLVISSTNLTEFIFLDTSLYGDERPFDDEFYEKFFSLTATIGRSSGHDVIVVVDHFDTFLVFGAKVEAYCDIKMKPEIGEHCASLFPSKRDSRPCKDREKLKNSIRRRLKRGPIVAEMQEDIEVFLIDYMSMSRVDADRQLESSDLEKEVDPFQISKRGNHSSDSEGEDEDVPIPDRSRGKAKKKEDDVIHDKEKPENDDHKAEQSSEQRSKKCQEISSQRGPDEENNEEANTKGGEDEANIVDRQEEPEANDDEKHDDDDPQDNQDDALDNDEEDDRETEEEDDQEDDKEAEDDNPEENDDHEDEPDQEPNDNTDKEQEPSNKNDHEKGETGAQDEKEKCNEDNNAVHENKQGGEANSGDLELPHKEAQTLLWNSSGRRAVRYFMFSEKFLLELDEKPPHLHTDL
ncbi:unnamed protein product [Calypogeia fissa]